MIVGVILPQLGGRQLRKETMEQAANSEKLCFRIFLTKFVKYLSLSMPNPSSLVPGVNLYQNRSHNSPLLETAKMHLDLTDLVIGVGYMTVCVGMINLHI